ncbi:MAG TPA: response regulator [Streptosporangiaceae bacterium]|nr:response regulator [Streptosporangiaceae bacterium]
MRSRAGPIVLVEPNPDDVILTMRALAEDDGGEVVVLSDGESLLSRLLPRDGSAPLEPAIILMDVHLPTISGPAVLARIRADERTRRLPVVMLSTSCEEHDVAESYRLGADKVVCKPVAYNDFARLVQALSAYWLDLDAARPTPEGMS